MVLKDVLNPPVPTVKAGHTMPATLVLSWLHMNAFGV